MQQGSRRKFLRLAACAALANSFVDLTKRPTSSRELEGWLQLDDPQAQPKAIRMGLISDLNGSYGSTRYGSTVERGVALLKQHKPDLVLCAGDMVAGQNTELPVNSHGLERNPLHILGLVPLHHRHAT